MNRILAGLKELAAHRFNLQKGKADEAVIIAAIKENVDFTGANLFALIFAIFIASIGLNVNSTAVIIGAMLISPIMGPVMGIGLGIGIHDLDLVKKGAKNLLVATVIGILTSAVYFLISPLHNAQSELLARTSPSTWDVFIAFFGGSAGMVAASRKEKNNVIPGVAIATALMPPLCTAGFGLATGNWLYFLGAIYLYFINSVFISIATYVMARYLKMHHQHLGDEQIRKKADRYIIVIVVITIIPSILMAYRIVQKSIFETAARKFVNEQFNYSDTQVVSESYQYMGKGKSIEVLLIGRELSKNAIDSLNKSLPKYKLEGVQLIVRQGLNAKHQIDLSQIKASILEDVFNKMPKIDSIKTNASAINMSDTTIFAELKILYPSIRKFGISSIATRDIKTALTDTQKIAMISLNEQMRKPDLVKLSKWLKIRYQCPSLKVVTEPPFRLQKEDH
ncbi:MAG TPA: DUF389 domain-containing protein [Mucilaginibacter sp.]|jgi:uncharacterized hydrophobic protein (TIGR00271 family)